ncbi:MAG: ABC transporter ATP-binding protein [Clostridiaceae bacterium]|nr:ABC transporter ATP-binding protein [Clostridiaceae bacterium]
MTDVLKIEGLSAKLGEFKLRNVSFNVKEGAIMGFVGKNGAGKTSTLKLILNSFNRDSGQIKVLGKDNIDDEEEVKNYIGYVPSESYLLEDKNINQHVKMFRSFYNDFDMDALRFYLSEFDVPRNVKTRELSLGMKMKAMIALALAHKPQLLILDEATANLDPISRDEIMNVIRDYVDEEKSRAAIISTHITSDLDKIADYITVIDKGSIKESAPIDEIQEKYVIVKGNIKNYDEFSDKFIGVEKNSNYFEGLICRQDLKDSNDLVTKSLPNVEKLLKYFILGGKKSE